MSENRGNEVLVFKLLGLWEKPPIYDWSFMAVHNILTGNWCHDLYLLHRHAQHVWNSKLAVPYNRVHRNRSQCNYAFWRNSKKPGHALKSY